MELAEYLTMKDIISEAGPSLLSKTAKRRRADLLDAIRESSALQDVVVRAYHQKQSRQIEGRQTRIKKARLNDDITKHDNKDHSLFFKDPDEDVKKEALAHFIDRTNNMHTRQSSCLSCAREQFIDEMMGIYIDELPNQHLLTPAFRHPAQSLVNGMLLHSPALAQSDNRMWGAICTECLQDIQAKKTPLHSLANGLWIGDVPDELAILNLPERLLIGRYFPAVYIIKLYPQRKGAKNWDSNSLNSGVRGNVSSYQLNTPEVAAMTEGNLLPHRPALLAVTIGITIVGPKDLPVKSLPSLLSVNRNRVKNALTFLKHQNHLYRDIIISEENLRLLPEDGLPAELLTIIKHSDQQHLLEQEREGYVIGDDDTEDDGRLISLF